MALHHQDSGPRNGPAVPAAGGPPGRFKLTVARSRAGQTPVLPRPDLAVLVSGLLSSVFISRRIIHRSDPRSDLGPAGPETARSNVKKETA
jgi:hypothetical protein